MMNLLVRALGLACLALVAMAAHAADWTAYDGLLKSHVFKGERQGIPAMLVDYGGWADDPRHAEAMGQLSQVKPAQLQGGAKMAYWINAYNLLTIDLIIREKEQQSIKALGNLLQSPWKKYQWGIAGQSWTLHAIEHDILRPMGDARIHMAINCASLSCPDLRREAYRADRLDEQLEEQAMLFLYNPHKGARLLGDRASVSRIFDWFDDDFEPDGGVTAFIARYRPDVEGKTIDYLEYDWRLNGSW